MKSAAFVFVTALLTASCGIPASSLQDGNDLADGLDPKAEAAANCTVTQNDDGSATITCPDGSSATVEGVKGDQGDPGADGVDGKDGSSCSVVDNGNGTYTMTCTNGTDVTWSSEGVGGTNPYIPDGVLYGSYTIENSLDIGFLNGVTLVTGTLTVTGSGVYTLNFPGLELGGLRLINAPELTAVNFPSVLTLRNELAISGTALNSFSLDVTHVGGNLSISNNEFLRDVTLPVSQLLGGVFVTDNAELSSLSLPITSAIEGLNVAQNPLLTELVIHPKSVADDVIMSHNASLRYISLPVTFVGASFAVSINESLAAVSAPSLTTVGEGLTIWRNASVSDLSFPSLTSAATLFINSNAYLCNSSPFEIVNQAGYPTHENVWNNCDSAVHGSCVSDTNICTDFFGDAYSPWSDSTCVNLTDASYLPQENTCMASGYDYVCVYGDRRTYFVSDASATCATDGGYWAWR